MCVFLSFGSIDCRPFAPRGSGVVIEDAIAVGNNSLGVGVNHVLTMA